MGQERKKIKIYLPKGGRLLKMEGQNILSRGEKKKKRGARDDSEKKVR